MDDIARKPEASGPAGSPSALPAPLRRRDREKTRQEILEVAFAEFAERATAAATPTRSHSAPTSPSG